MSLFTEHLSHDPDPRTFSVVWCLTDGKPGHKSQVHGLVTAIERCRPLIIQWLDVPSQWQGWRDLLTGYPCPGNSLQSPQLIIAAGHRTHAAALAVRRALGGRIVLLMKPTLPTHWFDLCVVPQHDFDEKSTEPLANNIITTYGVLNSVRTNGANKDSWGLLLIGGPSKHHGWDDQAMCVQVREIVSSMTDHCWTLTTSRRTPTSFISELLNSPILNLEIVPASETPPGWVVEQLTKSRTVFVSEDSVSMVYEALSANADVGLLHVPRRRMGRIVRGIDRLAESGYVIPFEQWKIHQFTHREPCVLQEADRCAEIVCKRFLDAA
ncbi:MAG: ELM1/GtrOC1 family putative glycosyltransferase [Planctomycetaceae bacterium]